MIPSSFSLDLLDLPLSFAFAHVVRVCRADQDHQNGVPAGGLFTGAEVIKSVEDREMFGGMANAAFDPCYHQDCDNVNNIDWQVLLDMSRACADVTERLALQTDLRTFLLNEGSKTVPNPVVLTSKKDGRLEEDSYRQMLHSRLPASHQQAHAALNNDL